MSANVIHMRTNFPEVSRRLEQLPEDIGNKAMVRALNSTVGQGKTQMAREIASSYRVSVSQAKYRLDIRKATAKGGALCFEAVLSASRKNMKGRSMNLIHFVEKVTTLAQARKRMKGGEGGKQTLRHGGVVTKALQLRFQIKRSGGQKMIPGLFIGNKGRTVFQRVGKERFPIQAKNTIDIPQMFNSKRINQIIRAEMMKNFERIFNREVRIILQGYVK